MDENRVASLRQKGAIDDPLTEILRAGARRLIAQAVEAEFETFLASNAELVLSDGRRRVVRHGHDPVRAIQTGIGPVDVQKSKARDRGATTGARIRFTSNILPKWARRTKSLDALLPVLYLRGISAGDFQEALFRIARQGRARLIVGGDRPPQGRMGRRISPMAEARFIGAPIRLRLGGRRLFAGANGAASRMHAGADRRDDGGQEGTDRLSDRHAGERAELEGTAGRLESARLGRRAASRHRRWRARVLESPRRGVLDDASSAMLAAQDTQRARQAPEVDATQRAQDLREIWLSPNRAAAEAAMTTFAEKYAPKYDKAVECPIKDRPMLLTFFVVRHGCETPGCACSGGQG